MKDVSSFHTDHWPCLSYVQQYLDHESVLFTENKRYKSFLILVTERLFQSLEISMLLSNEMPGVSVKCLVPRFYFDDYWLRNITAAP